LRVLLPRPLQNREGTQSRTRSLKLGNRLQRCDSRSGVYSQRLLVVNLNVHTIFREALDLAVRFVGGGTQTYRTTSPSRSGSTKIGTSMRHAAIDAYEKAYTAQAIEVSYDSVHGISDQVTCPSLSPHLHPPLSTCSAYKKEGRRTGPL